MVRAVFTRSANKRRPTLYGFFCTGNDRGRPFAVAGGRHAGAVRQPFSGEKDVAQTRTCRSRSGRSPTAAAAAASRVLRRTILPAAAVTTAAAAATQPYLPGVWPAESTQPQLLGVLSSAAQP